MIVKQKKATLMNKIISLERNKDYYGIYLKTKIEKSENDIKLFTLSLSRYKFIIDIEKINLNIDS